MANSNDRRWTIQKRTPDDVPFDSFPASIIGPQTEPIEVVRRSSLDAQRAELERLAEIEKVFNEGWLPALPAEPPALRLKELKRLRELIREAAGHSPGEGSDA